MLAEELQSLLQSLRQRVRRYVVWDGCLTILAVILAAFWIGLAVDYLPVTVGGSEMPRSARMLLLVTVAVIVLVLVLTLLIARLKRPLPDDSLALLVERHHPQLGGRLITAVQLLQPGRRGDVHSKDLLRLVHEQAAGKIDEVDPARVFRKEPLIQKSAIVVPLLVFVIGFAVISPSAFARAAARLTLMSDSRWPRRAELEMVGIDLAKVTAATAEGEDPVRLEFVEQTLRLPKGSSGTLRIRASAAEGREVPSLCTVTYRTDSGTSGQSNMRRVGRERDGYQAFILDGPPLSNLGESFSFSVRGLDDRLTEYRVEAVEPPAITEMQVRVRYPDYLREEDSGATFDLETEYQAGLRISEGSDVTLSATSSLPLGEVDAVLDADGEMTTLTAMEFSDDRTVVKFQLPGLRRPTAIRIVPSDQTGISAQAPFRYFLGAVLDEPPSVQLKLSGIQTAVTAVARLPIECVVTDDYAIRSLDAFVTRRPQQDDGEEIEPEVERTDSEPISVSMRPDRDGQASAVVDLRELVNSGEIEAIAPGETLNVFAEARDGYNLDGEHVTTSDLYRLQVVTAEELLMLLERRELGLRTRLEQTVTETQGLREQLVRFRADRFEINVPDDADAEETRRRELQILRLRVQQAGLQASKATEELSGIAESLDDILQEMINNRVDSADRQERLGSGVRDPLRRVTIDSMPKLSERIAAIEQSVEEPELAMRETEAAIQIADEVILELAAILEKMLDLESYNEILDLVRGIIDDMDGLKKDTKEERKKAVQSLFD